MLRITPKFTPYKKGNLRTATSANIRNEPWNDPSLNPVEKNIALPNILTWPGGT